MPDTPGRHEDLGFTTIIFWYIVKALTNLIDAVNVFSYALLVNREIVFS